MREKRDALDPYQIEPNLKSFKTIKCQGHRQGRQLLDWWKKKKKRNEWRGLVEPNSQLWGTCGSRCSTFAFFVLAGNARGVSAAKI